MSWLEKIESAITNWLTSTETLRLASAELRELMPIVELGNRVVVFKYDDVAEVLSKSDSFGVAAIYAAKMERTTGAFFLGMEATPRYRR
ncbi:MAG TPA: hypothetical protein VJT73_07660, partial [Polyangiaceae bacterium]|nr:hypothetical protein [Polyangiaceae bacterium]